MGQTSSALTWETDEVMQEMTTSNDQKQLKVDLQALDPGCVHDP